MLVGWRMVAEQDREEKYNEKLSDKNDHMRVARLHRDTRQPANPISTSVERAPVGVGSPRQYFIRRTEPEIECRGPSLMTSRYAGSNCGAADWNALVRVFINFLAN